MVVRMQVERKRFNGKISRPSGNVSLCLNKELYKEMYGVEIKLHLF